MQKSTSSFYSFLIYLERYYKFAIFGTMVKTILSVVENFEVYLHEKNPSLIPNLFLEILQRYCKLGILGTLGVPGHTDQKR